MFYDIYKAFKHYGMEDSCPKLGSCSGALRLVDGAETFVVKFSSNLFGRSLVMLDFVNCI